MKPLEGFRFLSIEQIAAAPYGTMLLAGLGAEVIKIENPGIGGDGARYTGPHLLGEADSQYFQSWNLGKRSVALDLKSPEGRAAFERLVATADAVINNLRGDQPKKLGLEYAELSKIKPSIVCLHVSAYGRGNSRESWPGYDYLAQAEAGLMSLTGEPSGPPVRFGSPSPIDYSTALTGMVGMLSALLRAQRTGQGCDVDVSLLDTALHQLGYVATWQLNSGGGAERQPRSGHYSLAPVQTFPTADGWIFVMCVTQKFWEALLAVLGRPDLNDDPRFGASRERFANKEALTGILDPHFRAHPTAHWISAFAGKLPAAPVHTVAEALSSAFLQESGMVASTPHPMRPDFRTLAMPIRIDGERGGLAVCPPLGANNTELLGPADGD